MKQWFAGTVGPRSSSNETTATTTTTTTSTTVGATARTDLSHISVFTVKPHASPPWSLTESSPVTTSSFKSKLSSTVQHFVSSAVPVVLSRVAAIPSLVTTAVTSTSHVVTSTFSSVVTTTTNVAVRAVASLSEITTARALTTGTAPPSQSTMNTCVSTLDLINRTNAYTSGVGVCTASVASVTAPIMSTELSCKGFTGNLHGAERKRVLASEDSDTLKIKKKKEGSDRKYLR